MTVESEAIFGMLRAILRGNRGGLSESTDTTTCYCLEGVTGPATVKAWGGKLKRKTIPVAWVEIGKGYVSYHLMGIYGNSALFSGLSKELKARMQGKTCFNFKHEDDALFKELEQVTSQSIAGMRKAGFISDQESD